MAQRPEEYHAISTLSSWLLIGVLCAGILVWGFANYRYIQDAPRQWNFGQLPDAPGESIYSSSPPSKALVKQLPTVPTQPASAPTRAVP